MSLPLSSTYKFIVSSFLFFLISNSCSLINAGGDVIQHSEGNKATFDQSVLSGPAETTRLDKGKGRARSSSELSLERWGACCEEEQSRGAITTTEEENRLEDLQERLEYAKERKVLSNELVKSLVAGCPEALKSIIRTFEKRERASDGLPKLLIFVGEPGVGKSELSRAMAQHLKFDLEFIRASYLGDEYRKSSEKDLRKIFNPIFCNAKTPTFIVFDELQALTSAHKGTDRASEANVGTAFWSLIDKYIDEDNIYIIGTLNKEEDLPAPLIRRAKTIEIPLPDSKARREILTFHLYNLKNPGTPSEKGTVIDISCRSILKEIAEKAKNFTGSDLCELKKEAIQKVLEREVLEIEQASSEDEYTVVKKEDLQKAFESIRLKVDKRLYPNGRLYWLTWQNAGILLDRSFPVINVGIQLALARRQATAQNQSFRYQRMATMLSYVHRMWTTYENKTAVEVLQRFENNEIPEDQQVSDPFLDIESFNYRLDGAANTIKAVPWVGEFAGRLIHVGGDNAGKLYKRVAGPSKEPDISQEEQSK